MKCAGQQTRSSLQALTLRILSRLNHVTVPGEDTLVILATSLPVSFLDISEMTFLGKGIFQIIVSKDMMF